MQDPGTQFVSSPAPLTDSPVGEPAIQSPGDSWQGAYAAPLLPASPIPAPTGELPVTGQVTSGANDSGTGALAVLPAELKGFNFGACFLTWIWSIGHQFWLGLLVLPAGWLLSAVHLAPLAGIVNIGLLVLFGIKGNEWAWQYRRWDSIQQFKDTEKVWATWGIVLAILFAVMILVGVLVLGSVFASLLLHGARSAT